MESLPVGFSVQRATTATNVIVLDDITTDLATSRTSPLIDSADPVSMESDSEEEQSTASKIPNISETRRAQNEKFSSW